MMDFYPFLRAIRDQNPLVHFISNWVTLFDCAQIAKTFGASPVMAHAEEEVAEMTAMASSLVLNIGTLTTDIVESMKIAATAANRKGIPVILDVCGAGATTFRNQKSLEILAETQIDVLKGNSSEIAKIAGLNVRTKGVDSTLVQADLPAIARSCAEARRCTVVITGKEDIVADADTMYIVSNGHDIMSRVVGTGCMSTAAIGVFAGASPGNIADAAVAALVCFEVAGELAARKVVGPASWMQNLYDCLATLTERDISSMQKVERCRSTPSSPPD